MQAARTSERDSTPWPGGGPVELHAEQLVALGHLGPELAVELVAADPGQVVALGVEEGVLEIGARRFNRRRLTWACSLVNLEQRLLLGRSELALLLPLALEEIKMTDEALEERLVGVAEGAQQDEERQATLARHAGPGGDVLARLGLDVELDPLTPVGMDGPGHDGLGIPAGLEDDARANVRAGRRRPARCR